MLFRSQRVVLWQAVYDRRTLVRTAAPRSTPGENLLHVIPAAVGDVCSIRGYPEEHNEIHSGKNVTGNGCHNITGCDW